MDFIFSSPGSTYTTHIYETVEEADTAPLFKIEYLNKLYMSRSDLANLSHANMICDASNANNTLVMVGRTLRYILNI